MTFLYIFLVLLFVLLSFNWKIRKTNAYKNFYRTIHVVKDVPADKQYAIAAFGSTFAYYAYDLKQYNGHNFSVEPQSVTYMEKTVNHFLDNVEENGIVLLSLAGCFFAADSVKPDEACQTYYSFLQPHEFVCYSSRMRIKYLLKRFFPVLVPSLVKSLLRDEPARFATESGISEEKARDLAQKRIRGWERAIQANITEAFSLDERLEATIETTTGIMARMIDTIISQGKRPVFVVLPVSCAFGEVCPKEFYDQILYKSLEKLRSKNVPILDYLNHEELSRLEYYMTADCLNAKGRKRFAEILMKDLERTQEGIVV